MQRWGFFTAIIKACCLQITRGIHSPSYTLTHLSCHVQYSHSAPFVTRVYLSCIMTKSTPMLSKHLACFVCICVRQSGGLCGSDAVDCGVFSHETDSPLWVDLNQAAMTPAFPVTPPTPYGKSSIVYFSWNVKR